MLILPGSSRTLTRATAPVESKQIAALLYIAKKSSLVVRFSVALYYINGYN